MQNENDTEKAIADFAVHSAALPDDAVTLYFEQKQGYEKMKRLLKKIWDRANPSILDDKSQTRLDPDILEELETILQTQPDDSEA